MSLPPDSAGLGASFRRFAETLVGVSELYAFICEGIVSETRVHRLMDATSAMQRLPTLLLAAVHDLLLAGHSHRLAEFYPSLGGTVPSHGAPVVEAFVDFCSAHERELRSRLKHGATQTNEVGRVAAVRPVLAALSREGISELALVELGASAGLNLLLEQCKVHYSDGTVVGDPSCPIDIRCELRGTAAPRGVLEAPLPVISHRIGLDRSPVSLFDERETRWLLACVWPDQLERFERAKRAIETARSMPPRVVQGHLPVDARVILEDVPRSAHLCITTTWVLAYLSPQERDELESIVTDIARARDVTWVLAESPPFLGSEAEEAARAHGIPLDGTMLFRRAYRGGVESSTPLASMHGHATWIEWLPEAIALAP